jgi:putative peptidoglycan lipid II flippase
MTLAAPRRRVQEATISMAADATRLARTSLIVAAGTVFVKVLATVKGILVADRFGTGDAVDAFLLALVVPTYVINIVSSAVQASLLPRYVLVRAQRGPEAATTLLGQILFLCLALGAAAAVVLGLSWSWLGPLITSGFSPEKVAIAGRMLLLLLPLLVLSAGNTVWLAALHAHGRFALAASAPAATALSIGLFVIFFGRIWGGYSLVVGTLAGMVLESCILAWGAARSGCFSLPRLPPLDREARAVLGHLLPMAGGAALMGGTVLVDQTMAAMLEPGSVAVLSYGGTITGVVMGLCAVAVGTSILPALSEHVAQQDWLRVRSTMRSGLRLVLLPSIPATVLFLAFSEEVVALVYQRGDFGPADVARVAGVQYFLAGQIPVFLAGMVCARVLSAMGRNRILFAIAGPMLLLDIVLNWIFMQRMGVAGIALSTMLLYLVSACLLFYSVTRELRLRESEDGAA